jgi:hypothetical protein
MLWDLDQKIKMITVIRKHPSVNNVQYVTEYGEQ